MNHTYFEAHLDDTNIGSEDGCTIDTQDGVTEIVIPVNLGVLGAELTVRLPFEVLADHVREVQS